jgi:hypothetical protein
MPDLFEGVSMPRSRSPSAEPEQRRFVLPSDLAGAIKHLDDGQLDILLQAVTVEAQRRRKPKTAKQNKSVTKKKKPKTASVQIPQGQVNLIRAAFKAGVKPSAIALQLRVPPSMVQRVLKAKPD